ncbi:MAG: hypothetical protein WCG87_11050, partial [Bacteroidota bacterium]
MNNRYFIKFIFLITINISNIFITNAQVIKTVAGGNGAVGIMVPHNIAVNVTGSLYVAEPINSRIRMINTSGIVTSIAGTSNLSTQLLGCTIAGQYGFSGDNGAATAALLNKPAGVAVDTFGNVYISDALNNRIRKINSAGIISTIAGNGTAGYNGDNIAATTAQLNNPSGIFVDSIGVLYIADNGNNRVRMVSLTGVITTIAGNGTAGYNGDNISPSTAELNGPTNVFKNQNGVYITDRNNNRIRLVGNGNIITTVAGNGTTGYTGDNGPALSATLNSPAGITIDASNNLYIADYGNNCIRKVTFSGTITTIAGNGTQGNSGDGGQATLATLNSPIDVCINSNGNLYIADSGNFIIRTINTSGIINTYTGAYTDYKNGDNGPAIAANACAISNVVTDAAGNLYFSEPEHNIIRIVSNSGIITTIAGTGTTGYTGDNGIATQATLNLPEGLDIDQAGNLYIADKKNNCIRQVNSSGIISTIAGTGTSGYSGDNGPATSARLYYPTGVTIDQLGNIYIADNGNHAIRMVNTSTGNISTIAGDGTGIQGFSGDNGPATSAKLSSPYKVAISSTTNNIYISDRKNNRIRKMTLGGNISTIAGTGTPSYNGDGISATLANLNNPVGISIDASDNIYIADSGNHRIRRFKDGGTIATIAGTGIAGYNGDGIPANNAQLNTPNDVSSNTSGVLYISDMMNGRARSICTNSNIIPSVSISAIPGTTICSGSSVTFSAVAINGGNSPSFQWKKNNINVGTNSNTYTSSSIANNDIITCTLSSNDPCTSPSTVTSNSITMTVNASGITSISISSPTNTTCSGTSITFTATTNLSGASYQWQVNGVNQGTNSSTYSYIPVNGDQIACTVSAPTGSCYTPTILTSNIITMAVNTTITTSISISTPNTTVCIGNTPTFTAVTNVTGGTYQWQVNGGNQGTNSSTFTYAPANGDLVTCTINTPSGSTCYSTNSLLSNTITMSAIANTIATLSISTPTNTICAGTQATFSALSNISGGVYQWKVNGSNVGTNNNTYTYTPSNSDVVTCVVTAPSGTCYTPATITSNSINLSVNTLITPSISIATPNTTICNGNSATFTATTNVVGGTYQWQVNGGNQGTNSSTFAYTPANSDLVTCTINTPSGSTCYSTNSLLSNIITMSA